MFFTSFHAMNIFSQSSNVGASSTSDTHIKTSSVSNLKDDLLIFLIKFYVLKPFHIIFYSKDYIRLFAIIPWNVKAPSKMDTKYSPCFNHRKISQDQNVNKLVYNFPTWSHIDNCKVGGYHICWCKMV